jgi:hypothetical protein
LNSQFSILNSQFSTLHYLDFLGDLGEDFLVGGAVLGGGLGGVGLVEFYHGVDGGEAGGAGDGFERPGGVEQVVGDEADD